MHLLAGRCITSTRPYLEKLELAKQYTQYYSAKTKLELVEFGKAQYLSIEGKGDPSGEDFLQRIGVLYPLAYTLKFLYKTQGRDFTVAKLEGL